MSLQHIWITSVAIASALAIGAAESRDRSPAATRADAASMQSDPRVAVLNTHLIETVGKLSSGPLTERDRSRLYIAERQLLGRISGINASFVRQMSKGADSTSAGLRDTRVMRGLTRLDGQVEGEVYRVLGDDPRSKDALNASRERQRHLDAALAEYAAEVSATISASPSAIRRELQAQCLPFRCDER